ncbi:MAG: tRNA (cytidine(56)-2'-O)-methyltransferase [Desulfurococcales archaeon]|nr:tRNA (cytidine(56)-2'-O)-methyltransferase [Desulfurococcales archaeon]
MGTHVYVLRLGHRPERDKRITTHVALVARAFGASGFLLSGICDPNVIQTLTRTLKQWGGSMEIACVEKPKEYVRTWKRLGGEVIHLTMYGLPVDEIISKIQVSSKDKLVIVGSEKVDPFYYEEADYNIAIGNQPHSEVAALAVFLDRLYKGRQLYTYFSDAKLNIIPHPRGKHVEHR